MASIPLRRGSAILLITAMLLGLVAQANPVSASTATSTIVHNGKPLQGQTVKPGTLDVALATVKIVDGVRFRVDGKEGPFVRPVAGKIAATVSIEGVGKRVVTAELFRSRKIVERVSATVTSATATLASNGAALAGTTIDPGPLEIELVTQTAVDGVRFRVDNNDGTFVRPANGKIVAVLTITGAGPHVVSAEMFRNRATIELVSASVTVSDTKTSPAPPEPAPSQILHNGTPLDGQNVGPGDLAVELVTQRGADGVRFRVNAADGAFVRPDAGKYAATVTLGDAGTHVVSAELFKDQTTVEQVNATVTVDSSAPPAPTPTPPTPPIGDGKRLGLHVTAAELEVWRQRAATGPYKAKGDESLNSPGDWNRIVANARTFMQDPAATRWAGPVANTPNGCVQKVNDAATDIKYVPSWRDGTNLRDAAFVALVTKNDDYAETVKSELVAQAKVAGVDFGNRKRYCLGGIVGDENPIFNIANWISRLQFAYDYAQIASPESFSSTETALLDQWFRDAAVWMQHAVDTKLDELFVNRPAGNYTLTDVGQNSWQVQLYQGGPYARTLQRRYNNRAATAARFITLVGVDQKNQSLIATGKNYVKELIEFGYYPQGVVGEFERWTSTEPAKGWKYAAEQAGSVITIADVLARAGDDELYRYTTSNGALGTAGKHHSGEAKALRTLVRDLYNYVDGTYKRRTPAGHLIDPAGDRWIHDTMLTMSNVYYKDPYFRSIYTRTAAPGYPSSPRQSQGDAEGGEWGIYPGMLFMFGQTEQLVDPYPTK